MVIAMLAFLTSLMAYDVRIAIIVQVAVVLDGAVSAHLVFGQRAIYSLDPNKRGRMNAIYIAGFFAGGSVASVIAAWCFLNYGWWAVVVLGTSLALTALIYSLGENPEAKESGFRA
jgi:predicted MFS family arabinose efflux permease